MKVGRVIGFDDGYFERGKHALAPLVGCVMKGPVVEGFRMTCIEVDGSDVTERILSVLVDREQFSAVFLYGNIFGGTNVVDVKRLYDVLKKPIVVVLDDKPKEERIANVFFSRSMTDKLDILRKNPKINRIKTRKGTLYVSYLGATLGDIKRLIEAYQLTGKIPEPLRLSHMVGREAGKWLRNC